MLLVTLIVTQREIFNMATWRPIKRFTCLIVSVVHSCIHRRFYVSLLFGPRVDSQEILKITVFRTDSQTTGGTNIWFVVIVKIIYFIDTRIVFFSVHVDFFSFWWAGARPGNEKAWGSGKVENSENSWKIGAGGEYMRAAPKVSWLQTSHHLTAKSKLLPIHRKQISHID